MICNKTTPKISNLILFTSCSCIYNLIAFFIKVMQFQFYLEANGNNVTFFNMLIAYNTITSLNAYDIGRCSVSRRTLKNNINKGEWQPVKWSYRVHLTRIVISSASRLESRTNLVTVIMNWIVHRRLDLSVTTL